MPVKPQLVLEKVFGYPSFRGDQAAIIDQVMSGGNAFVLMPTGGGKSLCYQIPAICREGAGIVVSPLIALMQDQVVALEQAGVRAAFLNSTCTEEHIHSVKDRLRQRDLDLLYVAPERLATQPLSAMVQDCPIAIIAIDEAHCVSQWGFDFRPSYRILSELRTAYANVPFIALTATADALTREDIVRQFRLDTPDSRTFISGFDRPNIRYTIQPKDKPNQQLLGFIDEDYKGAAGIVYCGSRKKTESTAEMLRKNGHNALAYHAGMDKDIRARNQDRFLREDGLIIVATVAFGMGIDKPDVRFVFHMDMPKSIEAYYQETGRAGRDGEPSEAFMVFDSSDIARVRNFVRESEAPAEQKQIELNRINQLVDLCESHTCRRATVLEYFGDHGEPCGNCDNCLSPPETFNGLIPAQKMLSCIHRIKEDFALGHVIDILMGNASPAIERWRHNELPTFGVGSDLSKHEWKEVGRQLLAKGHIVMDTSIDGFNKLSLGEDAREVLKGERDIILTKREKRTAPAKSKRSGQTKQALEELSAPQHQTFERLRAKRAELAREQDVPAFYIFSDKTLIDMVRVMPTSRAQMNNVSGIGAKKLERYGDDFLHVLNDDSDGEVRYTSMDIGDESIEVTVTTKPKPTRKGKRWSDEEEDELYDQLTADMPLSEIAALHDRTIGGIVARVPNLVQRRLNHELDREQLADLVTEKMLGDYLRTLNRN